jgi:hypothetical protein
MKKVIYSKESLSATDYEDISTHGSPNFVPFHVIAKEDKDLMDQITREFNLFNGVGFDGRHLYRFKIYGKPKISEEKSEENINYKTSIHIEKVGAQSLKPSLCDLEIFLIENGFNKD